MPKEKFRFGFQVNQDAPPVESDPLTAYQDASDELAAAEADKVSWDAYVKQQSTGPLGTKKELDPGLQYEYDKVLKRYATAESSYNFKRQIWQDYAVTHRGETNTPLERIMAKSFDQRTPDEQRYLDKELKQAGGAGDTLSPNTTAQIAESRRQFDITQGRLAGQEKQTGIESSLDRDVRIMTEKRMLEQMMAQSRQEMLTLKSQLATRSLAPGQEYARGWGPGGVMAQLSKRYGAEFTPLGREQTIPVDTAEAYNATQAAANPLLSDLGAQSEAERKRRAGLGG